MRKFFISILLSLLFLTLKVEASQAQTCQCTAGASRQVYVSQQCSDQNYIATCTGDPYKGTLGCDCTLANPGVNCTPKGQVSGKPCCPPYVPEARSGVCIDPSVNPYKNLPTPSDTPSPAFLKVRGNCNENEISTAIGCIKVLDNTEGFLSDILRWAVGVGSGIAFILMLYAGFMIMTAAGNPERLKAGQELLTSAVAGLILLILSIFILKFIGIDILGLSKFGFGQ